MVIFGIHPDITYVCLCFYKVSLLLICVFTYTRGWHIYKDIPSWSVLLMCWVSFNAPWHRHVSGPLLDGWNTILPKNIPSSGVFMMVLEWAVFHVSPKIRSCSIGLRCDNCLLLLIKFLHSFINVFPFICHPPVCLFTHIIKLSVIIIIIYW